MEQTPNKSQHTKLTLEEKILPPLLPGFELATTLFLPILFSLSIRLYNTSNTDNGVISVVPTLSKAEGAVQ